MFERKWGNLILDKVYFAVVAGSYGEKYNACLLYTSDAADERSSVDLGGRRIIKKKNTFTLTQ